LGTVFSPKLANPPNDHSTLANTLLASLCRFGVTAALQGMITMNELLWNPFVFVLGILLITVAVPVIAHYWYEMRKHEFDAGLKHDMLQRGMSAEEIRMVLDAPTKKPCRNVAVPTVTREVLDSMQRRV
jgi:hypothetical protein